MLGAMWLLVFLFALFILIFSSDFFVEKSEKIGLGLGISSFVIGVTVIAMGTSLPELVTSLFAINSAHTSGQEHLLFVPLDTIVGSNIANILIVMGIAAIWAGSIKVSNKLIESDIPLLSIFTGIFVVFLFHDHRLSVSESWLCLALFIVFLAYSLMTRSYHSIIPQKRPEIEKKDILIACVSLLGVLAWGQLTIYSLEQVIEAFQLENFGVITMILLAFSTSLPEVIVSIQSARKKKFEIAIGNVFGSNVFNMLLIWGISGLFWALPMSSELISVGLPFLVLATVTFLFTAQDDHIGRWEGVGLMSMYAVFILTIVGVIK